MDVIRVVSSARWRDLGRVLADDIYYWRPLEDFFSGSSCVANLSSPSEFSPSSLSSSNVTARRVVRPDRKLDLVLTLKSV